MAGEIGAVRQVVISSRDPAPPPLEMLPSTGGLFRDMTIHDFDMGRWLLGEEPVEVFATASCLVNSEIGTRYNDYDTAMIVSADSDLCPAVRSVRRVAAEKRVIAAFPPRRRSGDLQRTAHGSFTIPDSKIRKNLLPETVRTPAGVVLKRPGHWR